MSTTSQSARAAGAKAPADKKPKTAQKVKALQAEAAEGDVIVEHGGETYTLHAKRLQDRMKADYEFMELVTTGVMPPMVNELLDAEDRAKLKDSVRDPDTGLVDSEVFAGAFNKLMEAGGLGN